MGSSGNSARTTTYVRGDVRVSLADVKLSFVDKEEFRLVNRPGSLPYVLVRKKSDLHVAKHG